MTMTIKEQIVAIIQKEGYGVLEAYDLATQCIQETKESSTQPVTWHIGQASFNLAFNKGV